MTYRPKVAFVYDWFDTSIGGAERVIQILHDEFPDAPWYTSHIDLHGAYWAKGWDVRTSFMQKFPLWFRRNRILSLLFFPLVFESFDLSSFDVVVSITSAFAKGIVTRTRTKHICYLLTPPRWLWKTRAGLLDKQVRKYLQKWDYISAQRVDEFISISQEVAKRCKEYYGRESEVLYPPFDAEYWGNLQQKTNDQNIFNVSSFTLQASRYFLIVSRLEPYKKVELGIGAFAQYRARGTKDNNDKLVIIGIGSQIDKLRAASRVSRVEKDIVWLKHVSDQELAWLYKHCKAFIMPQEEDFGYVACEAVACDASIVAYAHGGQVEILQDYPKLELFDDQTTDSLVSALEKTAEVGYNARTYENRHIRGGSRDTFVATFTQKITQTV